jgi:FkbM family methyltransferase
MPNFFNSLKQAWPSKRTPSEDIREERTVTEIQPDAAQRRPTKLSALQMIVELGIPVGTVIDVGVLSQTSELIRCFPDKKHALFEPVPDHEQAIRQAYKDLDYDLHQCAVSNQDGTSFLRLIRNDRQAISHSQLADTEGEDCISVEQHKLDTIIPAHSYAAPFLLKIDVDGKDIEVLKGGREILPQCSCVVVEATAPRIGPTLSLLSQQGFFLWDIVDLCYSHGTLWQVDLVFLPKKYQAEYSMKSPAEPATSHHSPWQPIF